jgi:hypothetical protein
MHENVEVTCTYDSAEYEANERPGVAGWPATTQFCPSSCWVILRRSPNRVDSSSGVTLERFTSVRCKGRVVLPNCPAWSSTRPHLVWVLMLFEILAGKTPVAVEGARCSG